MKFVHHLHDIEEIPKVISDKYDSVYIKVTQLKDKIHVIGDSMEADITIPLVNFYEKIFVEIIGEYTDILEEFLLDNKKQIIVLSNNKDLLDEVNLTLPNLSLGIVHGTNLFSNRMKNSDTHIEYIMMKYDDNKTADIKKYISEFPDKKVILYDIENRLQLKICEIANIHYVIPRRNVNIL